MRRKCPRYLFHRERTIPKGLTAALWITTAVPRLFGYNFDYCIPFLCHDCFMQLLLRSIYCPVATRRCSCLAGMAAAGDWMTSGSSTSVSGGLGAVAPGPGSGAVDLKVQL